MKTSMRRLFLKSSKQENSLLKQKKLRSIFGTNLILVPGNSEEEVIQTRTSGEIVTMNWVWIAMGSSLSTMSVLTLCWITQRYLTTTRSRAQMRCRGWWPGQSKGSTSPFVARLTGRMSWPIWPPFQDCHTFERHRCQCVQWHHPHADLQQQGN